MKLGDLVNCALPVMSEYESEEYPYFFGGTCFLVQFSERLFIVTARHVLKDKSIQDLRIPRRPASRTFLTLRHVWTAPDIHLEGDDPDQHDWAIFEVEAPAPGDKDALAPPFELQVTNLAKLNKFPEGYKLVVRGFPKELSAIDFEALRIKWQAFAGTGLYVGPTRWERCHTLRLDEPDKLASYDGLSGSPVFLVWPAGDLRSQFAFAGMVLRGGNGLLHFLDGYVLFDALSKCY